MIGNCILLPEGSLPHCADNQAYERELSLFSLSVQRGRRLMEAEEELDSKRVGEVLKRPQKLLRFLGILAFDIFRITSVPVLFFSITLTLPLMLSQRSTVTGDGFDDFASNGEITYAQITGLVGDSSEVRPPVAPAPSSPSTNSPPSTNTVAPVRTPSRFTLRGGGKLQ
jgi:hypothetical protein